MESWTDFFEDVCKDALSQEFPGEEALFSKVINYDNCIFATIGLYNPPRIYGIFANGDFELKHFEGDTYIRTLKNVDRLFIAGPFPDEGHAFEWCLQEMERRKAGQS